jgi:hypothetical protein
MRTLSAALTTAQQGASVTPYVRVRFLSRDGATERTYTTDDATNRIISVSQNETRDFRNAQRTVQGEYSAIIQLRDADNTLKALSWVGYRVFIDWGVDAASGNLLSRSSPNFVKIAEQYSNPEDVYMEFSCISQLQLVERYGVSNNDSIKPTEFSGDIPARQILLHCLGGAFPDVFFSAPTSGGTIVNRTPSDRLRFRANRQIQIFEDVMAVGNVFHIGGAEVFNRISIDMTPDATGNIGVAGLTLAREYWNGSAWAALSTTPTPTIDTDSEGEFSDGLSNFSSNTLGIFAFRTPSDWATKAETVSGTVHTLYWIRFRVTAIASGTTPPKAHMIKIGRDVGLALDTSDSDQGDDFEPAFKMDYKDSLSSYAEEVLKYTLLGLIPKADGFHLTYIDPDDVSTSYLYDTTDANHVVYFAMQQTTLTLPNKIIFTSERPDVTGDFPEGSAQSAASVSAWGVIAETIVDSTIKVDATGVLLATRRIAQLERDTSQGFLEAKNNVGQEIWDQVAFTDTRTSSTARARVSTIQRVFTAGQYSISLEFGSYVSYTSITASNRLSGALSKAPTLPFQFPTTAQIPNVLTRLAQITSPVNYSELARSLYDETDISNKRVLQEAKLRYELATQMTAGILGEMLNQGESLAQYRDTAIGRSTAEYLRAVAQTYVGDEPWPLPGVEVPVTFGIKTLTGETPGALEPWNLPTYEGEDFGGHILGGAEFRGAFTSLNIPASGIDPSVFPYISMVPTAAGVAAGYDPRANRYVIDSGGEVSVFTRHQMDLLEGFYGKGKTGFTDVTAPTHQRGADVWNPERFGPLGDLGPGYFDSSRAGQDYIPVPEQRALNAQQRATWIAGAILESVVSTQNATTNGVTIRSVSNLDILPTITQEIVRDRINALNAQAELDAQNWANRNR